MRKKDWEKTTLQYLAATVFTALFGAVYECFSHEVYSYYMIYAFAVPLISGVIPGMLFLVSGCGAGISRRMVSIWNAGIAALTVGSLFQGVLEIYGTTNRLSVVYPAAGGALLLVSFAGCIVKRRKVKYHN